MKDSAEHTDAELTESAAPLREGGRRQTERRTREAVENRSHIAEQKAGQHNAQHREQCRAPDAEQIEADQTREIRKPQLDTGDAD